MKVMIYRGSKTNLGRHGIVDEGAKLTLTEQEFETVKNSPRFELVESKKIERAADYCPPVPKKMRAYDLTHINWRSPSLAIILDRTPKAFIMRIGHAMNELNMNVEIATRLQKAMMVDSIIAEARDAGWLSMEQNIIPDSVKPNTVTPQPKEPSEKSEKKKKNAEKLKAEIEPDTES
jgi:hypothetical protein